MLRNRVSELDLRFEQAYESIFLLLTIPFDSASFRESKFQVSIELDKF